MAQDAVLGVHSQQDRSRRDDWESKLSKLSFFSTTGLDCKRRIIFLCHLGGCPISHHSFCGEMWEISRLSTGDSWNFDRSQRYRGQVPRASHISPQKRGEISGFPVRLPIQCRVCGFLRGNKFSLHIWETRRMGHPEVGGTSCAPGAARSNSVAVT